MQQINGTAKASMASLFRQLLLTSIIALSCLLSSCGLLQKIGILSDSDENIPPEEQLYTINLSLLASADLNPDPQSRPSPVQVRIFVADPKAELTNKSFENIFDFSGNLIEPRPLSTVTLRPGQSTELALTARKSQTQLLVTAAYRDPHQAIWMAKKDLVPEESVSAAVSLSTQMVTISITP